MASAGLELALPSGIPTHRHNVTKQWSRLDQVFLSDHSEYLLTSCYTQTDLRGINTDHLPIITELDLEINIAEETTAPNYRDVNWEEFNITLEKQLSKLQPPGIILNQRQIDDTCKNLTTAIQSTIEIEVPTSTITSKSKRWWTKELSQLRKQANKLGRQSYSRRTNIGHEIHTQHKEAVKRYEKTLKHMKQQHWREWLERAEDPDIWTVHQIISSPASDGGKARIPILKHKELSTQARAAFRTRSQRNKSENNSRN